MMHRIFPNARILPGNLLISMQVGLTVTVSIRDVAPAPKDAGAYRESE
jgi:hypothetical protein